MKDNQKDKLKQLRYVGVLCLSTGLIAKDSFDKLTEYSFIGFGVLFIIIGFCVPFIKNRFFAKNN